MDALPVQEPVKAPSKKGLFDFLKSPTRAKTIKALVILIIVAAVPLTVMVSQQKTDNRQDASVLVTCNSLKSTCSRGSTASCRFGGNLQCVYVNIPKGPCYSWVGTCNSGPTVAPTTTCTPGTKQCSGNQPQLCTTTNGQTYTWVNNGTTCATGKTCLNGTCVNPATPVPTSAPTK